MMCISNLYVYYDPEYDELIVKGYNNGADVYSGEIIDNIYAYKNEETEQIVGVDIIDFSKRDILKLGSILPQDIFKVCIDKYQELN